MSENWQNNMLDCTLNRVYLNKDKRMVEQFIERYGESCYELGKADECKNILGLVNWKAKVNHRRRKIEFSIDFDEMLTPEQVGKIILKQLKE